MQAFLIWRIAFWYTAIVFWFYETGYFLYLLGGFCVVWCEIFSFLGWTIESLLRSIFFFFFFSSIVVMLVCSSSCWCYWNKLASVYSTRFIGYDIIKDFRVTVPAWLTFRWNSGMSLIEDDLFECFPVRYRFTSRFNWIVRSSKFAISYILCPFLIWRRLFLYYFIVFKSHLTVWMSGWTVLFVSLMKCLFIFCKLNLR